MFFPTIDPIQTPTLEPSLNNLEFLEKQNLIMNEHNSTYAIKYICIKYPSISQSAECCMRAHHCFIGLQGQDLIENDHTLQTGLDLVNFSSLQENLNF